MDLAPPLNACSHVQTGQLVFIAVETGLLCLPSARQLSDPSLHGQMMFRKPCRHPIFGFSLSGCSCPSRPQVLTPCTTGCSVCPTTVFVGGAQIEAFHCFQIKDNVIETEQSICQFCSLSCRIFQAHKVGLTESNIASSVQNFPLRCRAAGSGAVRRWEY